MIKHAFCPFGCDVGAKWNVVYEPATVAEPAGNDVELIETCKHADILDGLLNAMEAYALDDDRNGLHAWEEEALANATALGLPIGDPANASMTEIGMKP